MHRFNTSRRPFKINIFFSLMILVDPCSGTHSFQLLYHSLVFILLCISPGEKLLAHEADCSRPSSCEVRNASSYTSIPLCAFMVCRTGTPSLWQWTEDFRNRAVWITEGGKELCSAHGWKHFQGSRTVLFSVIMQRVVAISYRCFGTTYWSHPQCSRIQKQS